jgi:uncharacterized protein (DUF1501 family)
MSKKTTSQDRRDFLKTGAAFAATSGTATFATLSQVAEAAGSGTETTEIASDYKALVCVFLFGGQDHSNVIIPYQDSAASGTNEYSVYSDARSSTGQAQNESNNPTGNLSYSRATLAATAISSTASAVPAGFTTDVYGRQFALHPSFSALKALYDQGSVAVIANTGPLVAPIDRHEWFNRIGGLRPSSLYSHDDQQKAWMSGTARVLNPQVGIAGRIAEALPTANGTPANPPQISMLVSTAGINTFMLTGNNDPALKPYQIGVGSLGRINDTAAPAFCDTTTAYINANTAKAYCINGGPISISSGPVGNATMYSAFRNRVTSAYSPDNVYLKQWGGIMDQSIKTERAVNAALLANPLNEDTVRTFREYVPTGNAAATPLDIVNPPTADVASGFNGLAAQLRMVATLIRASLALGPTAPAQPIKRQVFFVSLGGFDTHGDEFWRSNPTLNKRIDRALDAFWQALGNIKVSGDPTKTARNQVTVFTMSDFGRTLDSNGKGSDHGWAGHHFVMGGAVKGGKIYGADHNVTAAQIPTDVSIAGQKSRYMIEDTTAGAMPRIGIPPLWYLSGNTGPGGKARTAIPNAANFLPLNHSLDRGELLPSMASDAYVATAARWFGIPAATISTVFPTLLTAHPAFDTNNGVGFMNLV